MIISHKNKFIFIKPRKIAGTSITLLLERHCGSNDVVGKMDEITKENKLIYKARNIKAIDGYIIEKHESIKNLLEHKIVTENMLSDYFTFTIERNSFEKVVSLYHFLKNKSTFKREYGNLSFSNFLLCDFNKSDFDLYTLNNKIVVDFVGQYHNLQNDFDFICNKIGIKNELYLFEEKVNFRNKNIHYSNYYNNSDIEICKDIYKREIKAFNYKFKNI